MNTVLIVSNDNISNAICRAYLSAYKVAEISSGVQALGYIKSHPLPALILMDMEMAGMNGLEVLKVLRQDPRTKEIPVIFTLNEGKTDMGLIQRLFDEGAAEIITRPVTASQLLKRVEYQFELQQLRSENARLKSLLEGERS